MSVDWELLADHLGGALTGTPQQAQVAQKIATDPAWARAADQLADALDAVGVELAGLPAPSMPAEVTARLDAALQEAPVLAASPMALDPAGAPAGDPGASGVGAATIPAPRTAGRSATETRRPPTRSDTRRRPRRLARWGAGVAAAAGVVAFAAVGLGAWQLPTQSAAENDEAASAVPDTLDAEPPRGIAEEPGLAASGTDYRPDLLTLAPPPADGDATLQSDRGAGQPGPEVATDGTPQVTVPPALDRLWSDPQARTECLAMVSDAVEPPPATIEVVDFAHFQAEPAVVIWVTAGDGSRWAWVVGPACGTPAAGSDLRFQFSLS